MRYISNNLLKDENIVYETRPHAVVFVPSIILFLFSIVIYFYMQIALKTISTFTFFGMPFPQLFALVIFLLAFFYGIKAYIMYQTSEYGITDKRIVMKTGWIQRRSIEIFLEKVEAIYVDQTIMGRIFGYGTIIIVGTGGSQDPFLYVPDPLKFRNRAQQEIDFQEHNKNK